MFACMFTRDRRERQPGGVGDEVALVVTYGFDCLITSPCTFPLALFPWVWTSQKERWRVVNSVIVQWGGSLIILVPSEVAGAHCSPTSRSGSPSNQPIQLTLPREAPLQTSPP